MMKTGLTSQRDVGSTTLITILATLCVSKINEKTLQIAKHLGRRNIVTADIEYSILSEWLEKDSCYNELRPYMIAVMTQGVVEIPDKYKEVVSLAWEEYNKLVVDNIDCPEKLSKACSNVFLANTIFDDDEDDELEDDEDDEMADDELADDNDELADDNGGYSSMDDMADEESGGKTYKECECDNCKTTANSVDFFYGLDPESLEHIDRIMFTTFRNLMN